MTHTVEANVASRIAAVPLPLHDVLELGLAVAAELRQYHERGEAHGAVTLTQVRFGVAGAGLAAPRGERLPAGYLAPELLYGASPDPLSDIFAFGVLLFQAATGESPFRGVDEESVCHAILHSEPPTISCRLPAIVVEEILLYRTLNGLVQRCLAKPRPARMQSIQKLQSELKVLVCAARGLRMERARQAGDAAPPLGVAASPPARPRAGPLPAVAPPVVTRPAEIPPVQAPSLQPSSVVAPPVTPDVRPSNGWYPAPPEAFLITPQKAAPKPPAAVNRPTRTRTVRDRPITGITCPACRRQDVRRSPLRSGFERLLGRLGFQICRCRLCMFRFATMGRFWFGKPAEIVPSRYTN